jgi:hypothetical protein
VAEGVEVLKLVQPPASRDRSLRFEVSQQTQGRGSYLVPLAAGVLTFITGHAQG